MASKGLFIVCDVEADGPIPGEYSMVSFGAVAVEPTLSRTFYGEVRPISDKWVPEALAISGISRETHEGFDEPEDVMRAFAKWIEETADGRPVFVSDNNGFDAAWINWYFHKYLGRNPFGYSSRRIGDMYCGLKRDPFAQWKHLRISPHNHNPVSDAKGNAEALLKMREMGFEFPMDVKPLMRKSHE
jgi:hypothetical protein